MFFVVFILFLFILDLLLTNAMEVIAKDPSSLSIKCERNINAIIDKKTFKFVYLLLHLHYISQRITN